MRECREALTKQASEFDPRTRLRQGFMSSVDELGATLKRELDSMVEMSSENLQQVDWLSKKAASVWLDFQMHRCRIIVRLAGNELKSSVEKVAQLQRGSLKLTISPKLGRYGTVKGVELDKLTTISGFSGESIEAT